MVRSDFFLHFRYRIPFKQWWMKIRPLLRIMAAYTGDSYEASSEERSVRRVSSDGNESPRTAPTFV